jgi:hypothetical protein
VSKPAPESRRSIPNVIPFGDWTVSELKATADIFGVSDATAYSAAQRPMEATLGERSTRKNPGIPGIQDSVWVPLALETTGIDPDKEYLRRLSVPADQLMAVANTAADASSLSTIREKLVSVMDAIKKRWETLTPQEWALERAEGWWGRLDLEEKIKLLGRIQEGVSDKLPRTAKRQVLKGIVEGKFPDVTEKFEPYSETGYLNSPYWTQVGKLVEWLQDPATIEPPFTIFTEGSSKLPFFQWSTVPGATCPGAGRCWTRDPEARGNGKKAPKKGPRGYCYSLSGWRNIVPYLRQLQNTIILRLKEHKATIINREMMKIQQKNPTAVVRLYVDGDFDSLETLEFWMHICDRYPKMRFYGYSKSWDIILKYDENHGGNWPENYLLNLSNGTFYERMDDPKDPNNPFQKILRKMSALKCTRGRFVAVVMPKGLPNGKAPKLPKNEVEQDGVVIEDPRENEYTREKLKLHREAVKQEAIRQGIPMTERDKKIGFFTCPGLCGFCLGTYDGANDPQGIHACGFSKYKDRTILIAVH